MRALLVAALLLAGCNAASPAASTPTPTAERGVLSVTALLDLSGQRSALGAAQRDAMQMWLDDHPRSIPTKLSVVDVGGSEAKTILALHRAVAEGAARAIVVGSPVPRGETLGRAIDASGVPVIFTLPLASDPAGGAGGRWSFSLAPTLTQLASMEMDDALERAIAARGVVVTDAKETIDPFADALASNASARGLSSLERVVMGAGDAVPATLRAELGLVRSVHCSAAASVCATVAQMAQSARTLTFLYLSYLTVPSELADRSELAARAVWPGTRTILADLTPLTAAEQGRAAFLRSFSDRHGAVPTEAASAYDAMSLLAEAARRSGPDDGDAMRAALERITMTLIASTYSFDPSRHAGFDPGDLTELRWASSRVMPALAPALGTGLATAVPARSPATPSPQQSPAVP